MKRVEVDFSSAGIRYLDGFRVFLADDNRLEIDLGRYN
jgi:hypothetical protein